MKFGFWTCHEGDGTSCLDDPPTESQLSALSPGVPLICCDDVLSQWMLRETFDSFEEGKAWMDDVFHQTDWEEYLEAWKVRMTEQP